MLLYRNIVGSKSYLTSLLLAATVSSSRQSAMASFSTAPSPPRISRNGDGTIIVSPADESKQTASIVFMHGLGDSSDGFSDVAEMWAKQLPHVKFILPTAPTQPVTMNMGMAMPSWYDLKGMDDRSNEECDGIIASSDRIKSILKAEHDRGLPYSRMAVSGFSQGGALSLFTGFQMADESQKLAGILVMSGYLASAKQFKVTPGLESTPVLHCHGTNDPMVQFFMAEKTRDILTGEHKVSNYDFKTYPMQHTVIPEEIQEATNFLNRILPSTEDCYFKVKEPTEMSIKELKAAIRAAGLGNQAVGLLEKGEFVKLLTDSKK